MVAHEEPDPARSGNDGNIPYFDAVEGMSFLGISTPPGRPPGPNLSGLPIPAGMYQRPLRACTSGKRPCLYHWDTRAFVTPHLAAASVNVIRFDVSMMYTIA